MKEMIGTEGSMSPGVQDIVFTSVRHGQLGPMQWVSACAKAPERTLLFAVLKDVNNCILKAGSSYPHCRVQAEEAIGWVMETDRSWPFSFENICDFLDLDVSAVRMEFEALYSRAVKGGKESRSRRLRRNVRIPGKVYLSTRTLRGRSHLPRRH